MARPQPNPQIQLEEQRIHAVHTSNLLDTEPEPEFDEAVRLAALICETPISLMTVVDRDRQWFKASTGLGLQETPREQAFCSHALGRTAPLIVPDAANDLRFQENPLVTGDPNIRFYAGMPLNTADGHTIGTLCVIDTKPRELTEQQQTALSILGHQVSTQIELRIKMKQLEDAIAEKAIVESELRGSNALFRAFMDNSPMVGYMKDFSGRMIYYNRPFAQRFEITPEQWLGKDDFEIWPPEFAEKFRAADLSVLQHKQLKITEETSPGPGNTLAHWRSYKFPIVDEFGGRLLAGLSLDISRERNAENELQQLNGRLQLANETLLEISRTDALTGLRNRRAFDTRLQLEFATMTQIGAPLAVILFDVDNFKSVNDTFGHGAGDDILVQIGRLLQAGARGIDFAARYGGEEFVILLPNSTLEAACVVAERMRVTVEQYSWRRRPITISGGVACRSSLTLAPAELVADADVALYRAKGLGRNRIESTPCPG